MPRLRALPYYGGKSPIANNSTGMWIASLLPYRNYYIEPFAGMAGVLLSKERMAVNEVLNDKDERIVNWWRHVRDHPDELAWMVENTPTSRVELWRAWAELDDPDPLRRAMNTHIVLLQSFIHGLGKANLGFSAVKHNGKMEWKHVVALSERMGRVSLECMDACEFMDRLLKRKDMVIYVDPPYRDADVRPYAEADFDASLLTEQILSARSFVAVSGYNDEWDHLGFHRNEKTKSVYAGPSEYGKKRSKKKVEVLWTSERVQ